MNKSKKWIDKFVIIDSSHHLKNEKKNTALCKKFRELPINVKYHHLITNFAHLSQ